MANSLPTPAPSPPQPASQPSISAEINIATRKQHTELNRLIVERLPLALPPHARDPALLGQGLASFASIYFVFESTWDVVEKAGRKLSSDDEGTERTHEGDILVWLASLRPQGLERSGRLRQDLEHIKSVTGVDVARHAAQERGYAEGILEKPHVLIAYAWVMYMAIFSGGRWIRQQLGGAGPDFWRSQAGLPKGEKTGSPSSLDVPGFSFLSFDSEKDGEDIKKEFNSRLLKAETLLSAEERQDVRDEAQRLFEHCIALVRELDRKVWMQKVRLLGLIAASLPILLVGLLWLYSYGKSRYLSHWSLD